ncbi:MAG: class I SAM-dependent methyltransferase [bacterium]
MRSLREKGSIYEKCRRLWESRYPHVKRPDTYFREMFNEVFSPGAVVLDAGCGRESAVPVVEGAETRAGVDISRSFLESNKDVHFKIVADLEKLPFKDSVFDIVISQYVVEHLKDPEKVMVEFGRVTKDRSHILILTTNALNYIALAARLIPYPLQRFIKRRFLKIPDDEIYPVYYRCNTIFRLNRMMKRAGFSGGKAVFVGGPFYFSFSLLLFRAAMFFERITDGRLRFLKFYFVVRYNREKQ